MESGMRIIKILMFLFNLLFWFSGIGLIIAGAVAQTIYKPYLGFLEYTYVSAPVLLIVIGSIVAIIAFFGCCGAIKENHCMLITFSVLLGIIFVIELAGGIAAYVERNQVSGYVNSRMNETFGHYRTDPSVRQLWNSTQQDMKCCGMNNFDDYLKPEIINTTTASSTVPRSCCKQQYFSTDMCRDEMDATFLTNATCMGPVVDVTKCPVFSEGCKDKLINTMTANIGGIGGVGVGIAFIQIIGIVLSCLLARDVRRGYAYA